LYKAKKHFSGKDIIHLLNAVAMVNNSDVDEVAVFLFTLTFLEPQ